MPGGVSWSWFHRPSEKASKAKTPPMAKQKPVYGDKKMVKAVKPKKGRK